jgi:SAM-dependent methyltransferase
MVTENPSAADWAAARGEKWRAQVGGMEPMLAAIDQPLIAALRLDRPSRIADIGCGGGGTTREIARRAPAGTVVHGYDISPSLVEFARSRVAPGDRSVSFQIANVANAVSPDEPYDRLTSRFGIMFFDDPEAAFANLFTWLRPGGRFAFAVWDRPAENRWFSATREVVAEIVDLPKLDPDAPGPFRYGVAETLPAVLDRAGFRELEVGNWRGELAVGGGLPAPEAAAFALSSFSAFGELLAQAGDEAVNHARQILTSRFSKTERDGIVTLNASVHLVTGTRR